MYQFNGVSKSSDFANMITKKKKVNHKKQKKQKQKEATPLTMGLI